jgi:hypothetical protein
MLNYRTRVGKSEFKQACIGYERIVFHKFWGSLSEHVHNSCFIFKSHQSTFYELSCKEFMVYKFFFGTASIISTISF